MCDHSDLTISDDNLLFSAILNECHICFDSLSDHRMIDLGCEHRICAICARKFFVEHVSQSQTDRCKCPEPSCEQRLDKELIEYFVEFFNKFGKIEGRPEKERQTKDVVSFVILILACLIFILCTLGEK